MLKLLKCHRDDLRSSGLNEETIREAGFYSGSAEEVKRILGFDAGPGLVIPYPDTDYRRVKPDSPPVMDGKPAKYLTPKRGEVRLYIPTPVRSLLKDTTVRLLITEGEKKALKATQEGFPAIGLSGVWCFRQDGKPIADLELVSWEGRPTFMAYDSDLAEKEGVLQAEWALSQELEDRGALVRVVRLPAWPNGEKVGLDDFLVSNGSAALERLLEEAEIPKRPQLAILDMRINRIKQLPQSRQWDALKGIFPLLVKLDPLDFSLYRETVCSEFAIKRGVFDSITKKTQRAISKGSPPSPGEKKELSEDEKKVALQILNDEELIESFLDTIERLGCVGEDENKVVVYLALTSRKMDEPINIIAKGESASGKSFLVQSVTEFFPGDEVLQFSALSPKALYHRKDDLSHKALIVYERAGAEESDYSIRILQSEGKLIYSVTVKNPETQSFETQDIEIAGPIAYVETTTRPHLNPENETRCFEIFIDESEGQTREIFKVQNAKYKGKSLNRAEILKPWRNAQRLLKYYPVIIPYIDEIEFPTKPLRVRRDRPRFFALIEASALLHQYKREKKLVNGSERLVANLGDYTVAYGLANRILDQTVRGLSPKLEELLRTIWIIAEEKNPLDPEAAEFGRKDVRDKLGWNQKTVIRYLQEAENGGYIEHTEGGKGIAYKYKVAKRIEDGGNLLLSPQDLTERLREGGELSNLSTPVQLGTGQVKPLSNKNLSEVVQPVQR